MTEVPTGWNLRAFDLPYYNARLKEMCVWKRIGKPVPEYWKKKICPTCRKCETNWLEEGAIR